MSPTQGINRPAALWSSAWVPTLIVRDDSRVMAFRPRPWDRLLTRLQAHRLDAQLADGLPPEQGRRLALRAAQLVAPGNRERLADNWENMLIRARSPRRAGDPSAPLARAPIIAAHQHILELVAALRCRQPLPARGVAMAHLLLTDGSGPLYKITSGIELSAALLEARNQLDPANALVSSS